LLDLKDFVRHLPDQHGNAEPVHRAELQRSEDQQVQGALKEIGLFFRHVAFPRCSTAETVGLSCRMSRNGSNAWLLQLDTRPLASDPPLSAGGGMGGEGPVDYARFSSPALADYQISFAVRVSGLAQPQAQTPITLRLFLSAPDDTLDPPDLNPAPDLLLRLDWILPAVGTEWQHDTLSLADATIGTGAISHFQAHHLSIQQLQVQWEIANAADADLWGFDNDNLLVVDDLILERLYESVSPLSIQVVGNQLEIRWTSPSSGTTQLETATAIGGPYTPVPGATSPHPASLSDTARFFRAYWTP
jgi:hypothetical protein